MKTLVFASNNAHKLDEIRAILGEGFEVRSLKDIGCEADIPETADSFRGNALQKAMYVKEHYGLDCFADDSGLQVDALGGEPGVFSARYAAINGYSDGTAKDEANMNCLLGKLAEGEACTDGGALSRGRFCTSIALVMGDETHFFDGIVEGSIIGEKRGHGGFGYDPIFVPEGYDKTFAEFGNDVKNGISHRARAVAKLAEFLKG